MKRSRKALTSAVALFTRKAMASMAITSLLGCESIPRSSDDGGVSEDVQNTDSGAAQDAGICTVGEIARDHCGNTCTCYGRGWTCTLLACDADNGPTVVDADAPADNDASPIQDVMPDGTAIDDATLLPDTHTDGALTCSDANAPIAAGDSCNTCCLGNPASCTTNACLPIRCIIGETTSYECNTCRCVDKPTGPDWECTLRGCLDGGNEPFPGGACGGSPGNTCGYGQYCAFKVGENCGKNGEQNYCRPRLVNCPYADYVDIPVCGCDGNTYRNPCQAIRAGTGMMSWGPCAP